MSEFVGVCTLFMVIAIAGLVQLKSELRETQRRVSELEKIAEGK